jgi:hypothetical protein
MEGLFKRGRKLSDSSLDGKGRNEPREDPIVLLTI